jgi:hypothetical protein
LRSANQCPLPVAALSMLMIALVRWRKPRCLSGYARSFQPDEGEMIIMEVAHPEIRARL